MKLSVQVGLVDFALQAIDGTKIPVASADGLKDLEGMEKLLQRVEAEIAALEKENRREREQSNNQRLRIKKEEIRERIRKAIRQLEPEAEEDKADPASKIGEKPKKERLVTATDPDARLMKGRHSWDISYNAQAVVDGKNQIIVSADVTNERADNGRTRSSAWMSIKAMA